MQPDWSEFPLALVTQVEGQQIQGAGAALDRIHQAFYGLPLGLCDLGPIVGSPVHYPLDQLDHTLPCQLVQIQAISFSGKGRR